MTQDDLHIYRKIGLRPRIANRFYAKDLVDFYKEQEKELNEKNFQHFNKSLSLFVEFLENQRIEKWESCKSDFWRKLLAFSYLDLAYEQSVDQTKVFFQTMKAFSKWLDEQYSNLNFESKVKPFANEIEEEVQEAVQVLDIYHQKVENPFLTSYEEVRRETLFQEESAHTLSEGVFQAMSLTQEEVIFKSLMNSRLYEVHLPSQVKEDLKVGTSLIGVLKEISPNRWEILVIDRVFPPTALPFLKQSIGVVD